MDEQQHRRIDIGIKLITAVLAIIGAGMGLWKYFDAAEKEFRKPYWERQISFYFQATSSAAILATSHDQKTLKEAEAKFWELYWGPLALVEDRRVEAAMVRYGDCLEDKKCNGNSLQQLSLNLAHTCRQSLGASWNLKLEELQGTNK
jgi:hypothetical protein